MLSGFTGKDFPAVISSPFVSSKTSSSTLQLILVQTIVFEQAPRRLLAFQLWPWAPRGVFSAVAQRCWIPQANVSIQALMQDRLR